MKSILQFLPVMAVGILAMGLTGCNTISNTPKGTITVADFGKTPDGTPVELYTLSNSKGMQAQIMTYGGIVTSLKTPDRNGKLDDVVLGFDHLNDYLAGSYMTNCPYFGALIGRYANRIANGKFPLGGNAYTLAINNEVNAFNGGVKGFDKVVWTAKGLPTAHGPTLILTYISAGGEEGYPGNLAVTAIYTVTEDNALQLDLSATGDQKTICNLTQSSYFNLRGSGDVLDHVVYIKADKFTPVNASMIPTGRLYPVVGTPFDFNTPHEIGLLIHNVKDQQIVYGKGYDHNWVLKRQGNGLSLAAKVYEPVSGREMEVWTTQPGLQFYTGNSLDGSLTGKGGVVYRQRSGFCLEPQHFPDSPNHPEFPTTELDAGQVYQQTTLYKFSAK